MPANIAEIVKIITLVVLYPKNLILFSLSLIPTKIFPTFDEIIILHIKDVPLELISLPNISLKSVNYFLQSQNHY